MIRRDISEERAVEAISAIRRTEIVPLDETLALEATDFHFNTASRRRTRLCMQPVVDTELMSLGWITTSKDYRVRRGSLDLFPASGPSLSLQCELHRFLFTHFHVDAFIKRNFICN